MQTYEANRRAVGGYAKAVAASLRALGMRSCSDRLVRYQCEPPVGAQRIGWYCAFWRWWQALWRAHPEGAEFLFEDFVGRVEALRMAEAEPAADWYEQVARCETEHAEALREAILARNPSRIRTELADDIREKRRLMAMLCRLQR